MSQYNLDKLFQPESIAVIGACRHAGAVGNTVIRNLLEAGFKGDIYPIDSGADTIMGRAAFPSVSAVDAPVDLAVVCTPMASALETVEACAGAGVGAAVLCSGEEGRAGVQGADIEARIRMAARRGRVRLLGSGSMGLVTAAVNLNASFFQTMPLKGGVAFIAQSGAMCATVLDYGLDEHIGFSHFVSLGSMLDVDFADLIDYLGNDPQVTSIMLYLEGLRDTRKFLSAARAVSPIKPIIVLKSGRSRAGAAAAKCHTGTPAGEDPVYDAAFKRAGIVRVERLEDLFSCADLLAKQALPQGPDMAIINGAGGLGVMTVDCLSTYGLKPAQLETDTIRALDGCCPPNWTRGNPVDFSGGAKPESFQEIIRICARASEVDAICVIFVPNEFLSPLEFARMLIEHRPSAGKPIFFLLPGGEEAKKGRELLSRSGFSTFATPEAAVRSFYYLYQYQRSLKMLTEVPQATATAIEVDKAQARSLVMEVLEQGRSLMTEFESKALLTAYGIASNLTFVAHNPIEAVELARRIGYPVAAKVHSMRIKHKSDLGGVWLDLRNADDVIDAYYHIRETAASKGAVDDFQGVTIQEMVTDQGYEIILGSKLDPDFGPVIFFGMGGAMTEIYQDRAIGLPPLNRLLAHRMMDATKAYQILEGRGGRPGADLELLEEVLIRLSQLLIDFPEIREMDINPFFINARQGFALDARIVVGLPIKPAPWHMALSTYPEVYEETFVTSAGKQLLIQPVRPEDGPALSDFFADLSEKSITGKMVHPCKFDARYVARLTQIDYDRDMVLLAILPSCVPQKIVGVARYFGDPDRIEAEILITISDFWQGQGIGAALLNFIMRSAHKNGIKRVTSIFSAASRHVIQMFEADKSHVVELDDGRKLKLVVDLEEYFSR